MADNEVEVLSREYDGRGAAFSSAIFQINAEKGTRTFYVHGDVLSQNSQPFKSIVDGNWEESVKREINLAEWDAGTVGRMIDYLYTKDYTWQKGGDFKPAPTEVESPIVESPTRVARPLTPIKKLIKYKETCNLSYESWTFCPEMHDSRLEELLLMHARVYALANYWAIEELSELALDRLLITLQALKATEYNPLQVRYIVELISYVYEKTCMRHGEREPMRQAVTRFTALELTKLDSEGEIARLMGAYGDFANDLLSDLTRRIKLAEVWGGIQHRYLAGIEIHVGYSQPRNCIQEYHWGSPNINSGTGATPVWLVPYFTEDRCKACTSFKVVTREKEEYDPRFRIPIAPEPSEFPSLISICDRNIKRKVSYVQLLRVGETEQKDLIQSQCGATGATDNIAGSAHNRCLFLLWK
ncbi:hypothetical protein HOY82DRAFT_572292 [Tuber indicum]|nr:hypothetical protein HOY82DRAFT_572292 [Tuber indicum]